MNPNTFNKITRLLNGESFITKEPGNSMLPLYKSNEEHLLTPITWEQCKVGDVVFCKVKGSCFTHKVYAIDPKKGCLIWYIQMSWYYFDFNDYWESYLLLWDEIMVKLKIK